MGLTTGQARESQLRDMWAKELVGTGHISIGLARGLSLQAQVCGSTLPHTEPQFPSVKWRRMVLAPHPKLQEP